MLQSYPRRADRHAVGEIFRRTPPIMQNNSGRVFQPKTKLVKLFKNYKIKKQISKGLIFRKGQQK